jgi:hypothetical protein
MSPASYQTAPPRDDVRLFGLSDQSNPLTRAGNGTRTRDPNLGKVVLYQLSYSRRRMRILASAQHPRNHHWTETPTAGTEAMEARGIEPLTS